MLAFASAHNAAIIEDDYDAEFRFGARPLDALQTLDRAGSVFYVGTFSKSLFPDLRLGFVVAPSWARSALMAAKHYADGQCSPLLQETLASFIRKVIWPVTCVACVRSIAADARCCSTGWRRYLSADLTPVPSAAGLHLAAFTAIARRCRQNCRAGQSSRHRRLFAAPISDRARLPQRAGVRLQQPRRA